jgi:hypothetical protein
VTADPGGGADRCHCGEARELNRYFESRASGNTAAPRSRQSAKV